MELTSGIIYLVALVFYAARMIFLLREEKKEPDLERIDLRNLRKLRERNEIF